MGGGALLLLVGLGGAAEVGGRWASEAGRLDGGCVGAVAGVLGRACRGLEALERGDVGWGVSSPCCARAATFIERAVRALGWGSFGGAVGGEGDVGLRRLAGEDVEGRVDGDFEVPAFGGILGVGLGESHNDLRFLCQPVYFTLGRQQILP